MAELSLLVLTVSLFIWCFHRFKSISSFFSTDNTLSASVKVVGQKKVYSVFGSMSIR